jgi:prepilin-type N-terminal cleavage/methylation domain-containing protein
MNKKKDGFTLIETLIAAALVAVVMLLMYAFFGQGFKLYTVESESADAQMNLRQVLSEITNKARLTDPEDITYASGVLTVGGDTYTLYNEQIVRNETAIASGIHAFNVGITDSILSIEVVNTSGKSIATSLSLIE